MSNQQVLDMIANFTIALGIGVFFLTFPWMFNRWYALKLEEREYQKALVASIEQIERNTSSISHELIADQSDDELTKLVGEARLANMNVEHILREVFPK